MLHRPQAYSVGTLATVRQHRSRSHSSRAHMIRLCCCGVERGESVSASLKANCPNGFGGPTLYPSLGHSICLYNAELSGLAHSISMSVCASCTCIVQEKLDIHASQTYRSQCLSSAKEKTAADGGPCAMCVWAVIYFRETGALLSGE